MCSFENNRWTAFAIKVFLAASLLSTGALGATNLAATDTPQEEDPSPDSARRTEAPQNPETPKLRVAWYGYLKLDAAWDDSVIAPG